jgi:hypothetical protein
MQECAGEGTVVVVNITRFRSDAIIVSHDTVKAVLLSRLSASDTMVWLSKRWASKKRSEQKKENEEFLGCLSWLWQASVPGNFWMMPELWRAVKRMSPLATLATRLELYPP